MFYAQRYARYEYTDDTGENNSASSPSCAREYTVTE